MEKQPSHYPFPPETLDMINGLYERIQPIMYQRLEELRQREAELRQRHPHWFIDRDKKEPRTAKEKLKYRRNKQKRESREKRLRHTLYISREGLKEIFDEQVVQETAVRGMMTPEKEINYLEGLFDRA